jgi:hypothetical protein
LIIRLIGSLSSTIKTFITPQTIDFAIRFHLHMEAIVGRRFPVRTKRKQSSKQPEMALPQLGFKLPDTGVRLEPSWSLGNPDGCVF